MSAAFLTRRTEGLRTHRTGPREAGELAQTVALNGLRSREATCSQHIGAPGIEQDEDQSLREIADPRNQGSAPAGGREGKFSRI
jgi:hypothetical protein